MLIARIHLEISQLAKLYDQVLVADKIPDRVAAVLAPRSCSLQGTSYCVGFGEGRKFSYGGCCTDVPSLCWTIYH